MLHTEHRLGGFFTWRMLPSAARQTRLAAVRVTTAVRAQASGRHTIGCSGHGRFRMTLGGELAFEVQLSVPKGTDPTEAYVRPPQHCTAISLQAGQSVDVVLEHQPADSGGDTSFVLSGVSFQLNVEEPYAEDDDEITHAAGLARAADAAIVVVGTTEEVESEGFDRTSLDLPGRQDELVRRVAEANPQTVVVVNSGAPVLLPWADAVPAILLTAFPGQEYGSALADVLLGPGRARGTAPATWPGSGNDLPATTPREGVLAYDEGLFIGYRHFDRAGRQPCYPFGHGLGYTQWEYLTAEVIDPSSRADGTVIRVRLRNTGSRAGAEVIQVYASCPDTAVDRPVRWLAGFAKTGAAPGEEVTTDIPVPLRRLAHWDTADGAWAVEPGKYRLTIGRSSRDLRLTTAVLVSPGTDIARAARLGPSGARRL